MANNRSHSFNFVKSAYPWLIVCCGMLFYCYNYFLRISPGVMHNELNQTFHITATQFGAFASFYYFAYTPMQLPAGMIYDKFGVRYVLFAACLMAVAGLTIFIYSDIFQLACAGRLLTGLGCAFAYIGTLKLASVWLPANRFATVAGITTAIGMTSGALTQKYLSRAVEAIGYREALQSAIITGAVLSILIILFVRNRSSYRSQGETIHEMRSPMNLDQLIAALRLIITNPQMWLIGVIGCLLYLPSSVFIDIWEIPYLKAVYGLTQEQAVNMAVCTSAGWIISCPIIGFISDTIKRRCLLLSVTGSFAALLLCIVFYVPGLPINSLYVIFLMIGFCCGAHPLCFALGKENNPIQISGTAVAVTNMLIMLGGAIFPPLVGKLLDLHSTTIGANGLPVYSASDFNFALSIVPISVAIGILLSVFLKETYCESKVDQANELIFKPDTLLSDAEPAK